MRWMPGLLLLTIACGGKDSDSDTDVPFEGLCRIQETADTFTFQGVSVGDTQQSGISVTLQCGEAAELSLSWRDPAPEAFTLVGPTSRTLQPFEAEPIEVVFAPTAAGSYEGKLEVVPGPPASGGIIVTFRGTGS